MWPIFWMINPLVRFGIGEKNLYKSGDSCNVKVIEWRWIKSCKLDTQVIKKIIPIQINRSIALINKIFTLLKGEYSHDSNSLYEFGKYDFTINKVLVNQTRHLKEFIKYLSFGHVVCFIWFEFTCCKSFHNGYPVNLFDAGTAIILDWIMVSEAR